jgi:hypothetical protein
MLGTTFAFIVILALVAGVMLDGAAAFGRAGIQAAAEHVVDGVVDDAVASYQRQLATAITSDHAALALLTNGTFTGTPAPVTVLSQPSAMPTQVATQPAPPADSSTVPRFAVRYSVTPTTVFAPNCSPPGAAPHQGADPIGWLQCDGYIQESRMSLHVTVDVLDPSGHELIVQRDHYVTLRLFAQPPYSAITGRTDGSAVDPIGASPTAAPHEGDAAGDTISGASPHPEPTPYPSGGTLIHVEYVCQPGSAPCALAAPPDPDQHLRSDARWTNGNAPQP